MFFKREQNKIEYKPCKFAKTKLKKPVEKLSEII